MSNDTTETPRTDALRHTDMWNTSGKLTESVKALIELCEALERENAALRCKLDEKREALDSIRTYGNDTLSGRVDGPDDRDWQRDAVLEMTNRAIAALSTDGEMKEEEA